MGTITIILLELPTGAVADLISRKLSVFIGTITTAIAMLLIGFGSTLFIFAIAYIIWAIGDTFISGAQSALIYDTLKDINQQNKYIKIQGTYNLLATISLIFATAISPFLYTINKRIPYILMGLSWILSSFIILTMSEPSRIKSKYNLKNHLSQIKQGLNYSLKHKIIRWYFLFSILISIPVILFNDLISQSYYINIGYSVTSLAIIIPLIYGSASLISSQAHKIENKLGEFKSLIIISFVNILAFLLMGLFKTPYILAFVILLYMSRDFRKIVLDNYINKHISSKMRATVISVGSMLLSIILALAYPLGGKLIDIYGINTVLTGFGIFLLFSSFYLYLTKPRII